MDKTNKDMVKVNGKLKKFLNSSSYCCLYLFIGLEIVSLVLIILFVHWIYIYILLIYSHYNCIFVINVTRNTSMWKNETLINKDFIFHLNIFSTNRNSFNSNPFTYCRCPTYYWFINPTISINYDSFKKNTIF